MIIKLLGLMDIISAFIILGFHLEIVSVRLAIYVLIFLSAKFIAFRRDIASVGDFIASLFLLSMILGFKPNLGWVILVAFYFLQKGYFSLK